MSTIFVDPSDGLLAVKDSYADRSLCQSAGCFWDSESKLWKMVFTLNTFETLLKKIPHAFIDPSMNEFLAEQSKKEDKLAEIRKMSKENEDISFRVMGLNATLFPYQKVGILYATVNQGSLLIGDQCGLGKTLQGLATALIMKNRGLAKECLVVTPASLKYNWPLEISKFTNEKCIVIDGKKPEDRIVQWLDNSCFFKIVNYELVVEDLFGGREYKENPDDTTEKIAKKAERKAKVLKRQRLLSCVKNKVYGIIIVDECHLIKHTSSRRHQAIKNLKAKTKLFLTGTPMDGRLEELYNIMTILAPGVLGSRTYFNTKHVITDFFGTVKGYKNIKEVQEKIAPFFLRRLKKDVLKDLPEKTYETKLVSLTPEEMKIYNDIKKGKHPSVCKDGVVAEPMVRAIRCMQFCNFPQMIDPTCNSSTKMTVLRETIEELANDNGQKLIIFTQFKQLLNVIQEIMVELKLKFLRIDGDTDKATRADYQKLFNEDDTIDCIIGTEAMSTGLNLQKGDAILHVTQSWMPSFMEQREGRSLRIGRVGNVLVLNFICRNTIEEKIKSVLYSKDKITSETLGDGMDEVALKKLGPKELEALM